MRRRLGVGSWWTFHYALDGWMAGMFWTNANTAASRSNGGTVLIARKSR